jgi:hypothetical protein
MVLGLTTMSFRTSVVRRNLLRAVSKQYIGTAINSPLVAAGAPSFVLIQKKQKIKTKKSFPAHAFTHRPQFFVGPLPAFDTLHASLPLA